MDIAQFTKPLIIKAFFQNVDFGLHLNQLIFNYNL